MDPQSARSLLSHLRANRSAARHLLPCCVLMGKGIRSGIEKKRVGVGEMEKDVE